MRISSLILTAGLTALLTLPACAPKPGPGKSREALTAQESEKLNDWFEARYTETLARSPMRQTYYGLKDSQDRLDDVSKLAEDETAALQKSWLKELGTRFDKDRLEGESLLSYRLYEYSAKDTLAAHAFADHEYVFNPMSGPHSSLPSFMVNFHAVDTAEDAKAYVARLKAFDTYLGEYTKHAEAQFENGVMLPRFAYAKMINASRNVITGAPFTHGPDSPLLADVKKKFSGLAEQSGAGDDLITEARAAMKDHVQPAYENLIAMFVRHEAAASLDDGAWKLPKGKAFYNAQLKHYTTTDLTANEIHEIGLKDVARIQGEMREIMQQVEFDGTLQDFFAHLRSDPKFTYSNDDTGRTTYIREATNMIDTMKGELDALFITKPKADMVVKRVEPFREDTAFGAFYNQPAMDGSRPGTYYINLKDMRELPIYQMQALAYHEGIPGHHMQIAIAMELEGLPKFRTTGNYTAYTEGWALYAESVPGEFGLYTDPYQDFGRLSMEIFRSARLVVDTGIHAKKWTRQQAVDYMMENTANSEGDIRSEVDRYIVWPGQATAYKIGMLKIVEIREKAEAELGDDFDIREFHDVILASGSVPLMILEELVDEWTAEKKR